MFGVGVPAPKFTRLPAQPVRLRFLNACPLGEALRTETGTPTPHLSTVAKVQPNSIANPIAIQST
ncbi:hypothetical protein H9L39_01673 [Fusarium oxysporum f. sp. albedinis]|nr:hypothetical protein H9L39_01673 [Fusarium oxysporum f. sp. albedinis]